MTPAELTASLKSAEKLLWSGDAAGALQHCENVLAVSANHVIAITLAGLAQLELNQLQKAQELLHRALQMAPQNLHARFGLGKIMEVQRQYQVGASHYFEIIKQNSRHHAARVGYANCSVSMGSYDEANEIYRDVLKLTGDQHLFRNLGIVALAQNNLTLAEHYFRKLLEAFPEDPDAHSQMAAALLKQERFVDGWPYYESRLENSLGNHQRYATALPTWDGSSGKRVLVWCEEGPGDIAMFASVISRLLSVSEQVTVAVEDRFHSLFQRSFGADLKVIALEQIGRLQTGDYDARIALVSCMHLFRADIASFAETAAGYLQPDMDRVMRYRQVLGSIAKSRKVIAINWRSLSKENGEQRSIPLEQLLSALPRDQYLLVNLQYGDVGAEIAEAEAAGYHLETLSDLNITQDLDGLVAAIAACDYQVAIDNTAVHLAGAIGVGQLVLLPFASNWRWGLGRNSCLFYQNTRLLSQSSMGDWSEPLLKLPALLESSLAAE
tara:strand:- start:136 stop:1623 length:1488 start_codon:yes stop_codon:yes gene_type:complete